MMYRQFLNYPKLRASFWLAATMVALLAAPVAAQQGEKEGAKTIFYNPSTGAASKPGLKPKPKTGKPPKDKSPQSEDDKILVPRTQVEPVKVEPAKNAGLHYWFEMEGVGKVSEDRVFYTGDRIRLHLRSNMDGYLSLWAYDSSGRSQLLFPKPSEDGKALTFSEDSNYVRANTEYSPRGAIVFNPPPEEERLLIFFSTSKDDVPSPQKNSLTAQQISEATQTEGSKSLLFEVERKDQTTFGSYIANPKRNSITKEIRLKHKERQ